MGYLLYSNAVHVPGLCLSSLGSSCLPRKTKLEHHNIFVYINGTPYCTSIQLEHHRGPCRCSCQADPGSCSSSQVFDQESCSCSCPTRLTPDKVACVNSSLHTWNSEGCRCECRPVHCVAGLSQDAATCHCSQPQQPNCQLYNTPQLDGSADIYTLYVGVVAIAVIALTVTATVCCFVSKRRTYQDLALSQGGDHPGVPTAYTITINQSTQDLEHLQNFTT